MEIPYRTQTHANRIQEKLKKLWIEKDNTISSNLKLFRIHLHSKMELHSILSAVEKIYNIALKRFHSSLSKVFHSSLWQIIFPLAWKNVFIYFFIKFHMSNCFVQDKMKRTSPQAWPQLLLISHISSRVNILSVARYTS